MSRYNILHNRNTLRDKLYFSAIYILLFLIAINYKNLQGSFFAVMIFVSGLRLLLKGDRLSKDMALLWILLFSTSYYLIDAFHFGFSFEAIIKYLFGPIGAYITGNFILNKRDNYVNKSFFISFIIATGFFLHGFLNILFSHSRGTLDYFRLVYDIWTQEKMAATGISAYFVLIIAQFITVAKRFYDKTYRNYLFLLLIFFLCALYSTIILGNRALLFICIILFLSSILFINNRERKLSSILSNTFVIMVIGGIILHNLEFISNFIQNSALGARLGTTGFLNSNGRFDLYIDFFEQFLFYPLGGAKINLARPYVHNVWLDIYNLVGMFPFIFYLGYTIRAIKNLLNLFRLNCSDVTKIIMLNVHIALYLLFMVEPIMQFNIYLFLMLFLYDGMVARLLKLGHEVYKKKH